MLVDQCLNGGRAPRPDIVDHLYRVCLLWALLPGVKTIDWLIDWKVSRQRSRVAEFVTVDVWQIQPRERVDSSRRRVGVSNCPWSVSAGGGGGVLTGFTGGHREACESPPPLRSLISRQGLRDVSTADIGARRQITTGYRHLRRTVRPALTDYHRQAARWRQSHVRSARSRKSK